MTASNHLRYLLAHPAVADDATVERVTNALWRRSYGCDILPEDDPDFVEEYRLDARAAIAALLEPITGSLLVSGVITSAAGRLDDLEAENARLKEALERIGANYPQDDGFRASLARDALENTK